MTGIITAATGVFVIPAVPYLQAIGLEKDQLVQALGLSFTVSTLALAANIARAGALNVSNDPCCLGGRCRRHVGWVPSLALAAAGVSPLVLHGSAGTRPLPERQRIPVNRSNARPRTYSTIPISFASRSGSARSGSDAPS